MHEHLLRGRRVLIAEDEYLLAYCLRDELEQAGATVLGPAPSVDAALALIESSPMTDGAVLDINLNGELVFAAADALAARGVPFVFTTGYEQGAVPERYSHVTRYEKPFDPADIVRALLRELPN